VLGKMKNKDVVPAIIVDDYDRIKKWSYTLAKQYAIAHLVPQGVISSRKFDEYKKLGRYLPENYPRIPDEYFTRRNVWQGWTDFLGNPNIERRRTYLNYADACRVVRLNRITNSVTYRNWGKRPYNLPARPELHYQEWKGWTDFLGNSYKTTTPKHASKLKERDVRIIKNQLGMGIKGSVLAKTFKVSEMQISRIRNGANWSEI
jgi:hypothetical protein